MSLVKYDVSENGNENEEAVVLIIETIVDNVIIDLHLEEGCVYIRRSHSKPTLDVTGCVPDLSH